MTDEPTDPLTRGEWESLLATASASNRKLLYRLAIHHGVVEPPPDGKCPCCGRAPATEPRQERLIS